MLNFFESFLRQTLQTEKFSNNHNRIFLLNCLDCPSQSLRVFIVNKSHACTYNTILHLYGQIKDIYKSCG